MALTIREHSEVFRAVRNKLALLIRDGGDGAVKLGEVDGELLVECFGLVLKETDRGGLPQNHGYIAIAAPVDSGVDPVAEGDVVGKLV